MVADPQITTLWEFGLFMLAPVAVAVIFGKLLRWKDQRLDRPVLQGVWERKTPAITATDATWSPFESVESLPNADRSSDQSSLPPKAVA